MTKQADTANAKKNTFGISKATFRRLPRYHQILSTFKAKGQKYISSGKLADILELKETLVRKDMADLKIRGKQNQGYLVEALLKRIEDFLGLQEITEAVIVGAGHLGKALAQFGDFFHYGLKIVGIFDVEESIIGQRIGAVTVQHVDQLRGVIERRRLRMIILTTPKAVAQSLTDLVIEAGVKAIWNFTPQELTAPNGIYIRNEQIVAGFMAVSHFLKNLPPDERPNNEVDLSEMLW